LEILLRDPGKKERPDLHVGENPPLFLKPEEKLLLPSIKENYPHSGLLEAFSWEGI